ncbi:insulin-like growth factor-binding protein complex acid labile subunit [Ptychodera flava]|uniref:insulin-like growth factor-binding protein complex acid labile subunit n=1 Tax=Ptychodera flava TaxID=63121 RepID=UPI00396A636E
MVRYSTQSLVALFILIYLTATKCCPQTCRCQSKLSKRSWLWLRSNGEVDCSRRSLTALPLGIKAETVNLDLSYNDITTLLPEAFSSLSRLKYLHLKNNAISVISSRAFHGLISLEKLYIDYNDVITLPENVFSSLSRLKYLYLGKNAISVISSGAFHGLTSLEKLYLDYNDVITLPENVFSSLTRLKHLYLNDNAISTISSKAFTGLSNLYELTISYNEITSLPASIFHNLQNLHRLEMDHNKISSVPIEVLRSLPSLQHLYLSNNLLTDVSTLNDLPNLRSLKLDGNCLKVLQDGVFEKLTKLRSLYLKRCCIETVFPSTFRGLSNMTELFLDYNKLIAIPTTIFDDMQNLRRLGMDGNKISSLPDTIYQTLNKLRTLSFNGNNLTTLPFGIFDGSNKLNVSSVTQKKITSLRYLDLGNNLLTNVRTVYGLPKLETLTLDGNCIKKLQDGVFKRLTKLRFLKLQSCCIKTVFHSTFRKLSNTMELVLDNNKLETLPSTLFNDMHSLKRLYLRHNRLTHLPSNIFTGLPLVELELDHNKLHHPPVILSLNELHFLSLSHNDIGIIPDNFSNPNIDIWNLDFSFNKLSRIPKFNFTSGNSIKFRGNPISRIGPDAFSWISAEDVYIDLAEMGLSYISDGAFRGMTLANRIYIDLSWNQLSFLSDSLIFNILSSDGEQLIDLRFYGNPWACDCRLRGLRQLIENYRVSETIDDPFWRFGGPFESIEDYGEGILISSWGFICRTPQIYAGFNVMDMSPETFICTVPEFAERVGVTSVDEGDTAELNCRATGVPEPSVYWITPGGNLVNGTIYNDTMGVYEELRMNSQGTLFITSSRTEHSGTYVCIATNMKGTAAKVIIVRVNSRMTSSITNITKPVDESSTISTNIVEGRRFQNTDTNFP